MSSFSNKILKFIFSKKKQILFALFALICIILDKDSSELLLKSAAPAVVAAAAASSGTATAGGTAAAAAGGAAASSSAAAASGAASTGVAASNAGASSASSMAASGAKTASIPSSNFPTNSGVPKNTNPKSLKSDTLSSNTITDKKLSVPDRLDEGTSKASQKAAGMSDVQREKSSSKSNMMNPQLNKSDGQEDEEFDNASDKAIKTVTSPMLIGCAIFGPFFGFIILVPLLILALINPTNSTLSNIDCEMQQGGICAEDEEENSFWDKLHNFFKYGTYGSNSEVVLNEIEDTYNKIKEEYDFIISLPLLTSSLFSDKEYIETKIEDGKITITDEMLDRVQYIYDMAMLQLIPSYNVYNCESYNDQYGNIQYNQTYQYTTVDEEEVVDISEGKCGIDIYDGTFMEIEYSFDVDKYFERLESSEELDLVYAAYTDSDKLLVNKIMNQYNIYKNIYKISDDSSYDNVPMYLEHDSSVNLSSPIKGRYSITSPFGMRTGEYAGMHTGIDIVSSDKNIYAAGNGVVTRSNVETEGGNVIEITHTDSSGRKYVTQYAHLSERHVNVGDVVNSGDVIGIMGSTGTMASGVHLHFSMWEKEPYELLNPRKLFNEASNY